MLKIENGCVITHTPYNSEFVAAAKRMGGRWDKADNAWIFNEDLLDEVEYLLEDFYGYGEELVNIELSEPFECLGRERVSVFGRPLFSRTSRDSEVKIYSGISVIGEFPESCGSRNNPVVGYPSDGTRIIIRDIPKSKIKLYEEFGIVKIREAKKPTSRYAKISTEDLKVMLKEITAELEGRDNG